jgi:hypothetical protein
MKLTQFAMTIGSLKLQRILPRKLARLPHFISFTSGVKPGIDSFKERYLSGMWKC